MGLNGSSIHLNGGNNFSMPVHTCLSIYMDGPAINMHDPCNYTPIHQYTPTRYFGLLVAGNVPTPVDQRASTARSQELRGFSQTSRGRGQSDLVVLTWRKTAFRKASQRGSRNIPGKGPRWKSARVMASEAAQRQVQVQASHCICTRADSLGFISVLTVCRYLRPNGR